MNQWGKTTRGEKYSNGIEFRNRKRELSDWENEKLAETLQEPKEPAYPDVLAEVPGLVLKSDSPDLNDAVMTPPPPTHKEQTAAALENAMITPDSDVIRGMTGVHRGNTGVVSDLLSSVTSQRTTAVRRNETTTRPNLIPPNVEGINPQNLICLTVQVKDVQSDDKDEDVESVNAPLTNLGGGQRIDENVEAAPQLGRGARIQNPPDYYQADHTNIRYSYSNKADVVNTCFQGAGYGAKNKLKTECRSAADHIDRLMTENPPPVGFTEEQLDNHIMGVVMTEHFSLKKEIGLFGDKAEEMLQLQNSGQFTTWVPTNP